MHGPRDPSNCRERDGQVPGRGRPRPRFRRFDGPVGIPGALARPRPSPPPARHGSQLRRPVPAHRQRARPHPARQAAGIPRRRRLPAVVGPRHGTGHRPGPPRRAQRRALPGREVGSGPTIDRPAGDATAAAVTADARAGRRHRSPAGRGVGRVRPGAERRHHARCPHRMPPRRAAGPAVVRRGPRRPGAAGRTGRQARGDRPPAACRPDQDPPGPPGLARSGRPGRPRRPPPQRLGLGGRRQGGAGRGRLRAHRRSDRDATDGAGHADAPLHPLGGQAGPRPHPLPRPAPLGGHVPVKSAPR